MDSRPRLHGGRLCAGMTGDGLWRERGVPCAGMTEGEALHGMTGKGRVGLKPTPTMENVGGGWSRGTPLREGGWLALGGGGFDSEGGW